MMSVTEKFFARAPASAVAACAAFDDPPGTRIGSRGRHREAGSRIQPNGRRAAGGSASGGSERIPVRPARERASAAGSGGRRRRGTGQREGAAGQQGAGTRGVQDRRMGLRLIASCLIGSRLIVVPRLFVLRLIACCLIAQGVPFAYLGDTLSQPDEKGGKTVEEGGGDHVCEHI